MTHIALIFGGPSAEHEVSLVSARNIFEVLEGTQLRVSLIGVTKEGQWKLIKGEDLKSTDFVNPLKLEGVGLDIELVSEERNTFIQSLGNPTDKVGPIDAAFPIIHGPYGEDGVLQAELNQKHLEFIGSDTLACENSFDKAKTKEIIKLAGIKQAPWLVYSDTNPEYEEVKKQLGLPFFIKPANMGSSLGISKVKTKADFQEALANARIFDKKIVIEKGVQGREIECALLEQEGLSVSGLGEVKPHHDFYSYEAKYLDPNGAELIIPAQIEPQIAEKIRDMAKTCFEALNCRDYARADFFLTQENEIFFNEINTHPGFTNISQFPMLWKQEGLSYRDLILHLVNRAIKRS